MDLSIIEKYNKLRDEIYDLFDFEDDEEIVNIIVNEEEITDISISKIDEDALLLSSKKGLEYEKCCMEHVKLMDDYIMIETHYASADLYENVNIYIFKAANKETLNKLKLILEV